MPWILLGSVTVGLVLGFTLGRSSARVLGIRTESSRSSLRPHRSASPQGGHSGRGGESDDEDGQNERRRVLRALEKSFRVGKSDLSRLCRAFVAEIELGLERSIADASKYGQSSDGASSLPMLPSFVDQLPTGEEQGTYLAIDFGGTHVRIIKVILGGGSQHHEHQRHHHNGGHVAFDNTPKCHGPKVTVIQSKMIIPEATKVGAGQGLFDYIAQCVLDFLQKHPIEGQSSHSPRLHSPLLVSNRSIDNGEGGRTQTPSKKTTKKRARHNRHSGGTSGSSAAEDSNAEEVGPIPLSMSAASSVTSQRSTIPLGFTFSFPVSQGAIDSGTILHMSKDFDCPDLIGKDPVCLLQEALNRKVSVCR